MCRSREKGRRSVMQKCHVFAKHQRFSPLNNVAQTAWSTNRRAIRWSSNRPSRFPIPDSRSPTVPSVSVTAASRLHFGMLSFGRPDTRQFGGLGLMVDWPGLRLRMTPADRLTATGPHADRALQFAARAIAALEQEEPERFTAGPQTPAIEI